MPSFLTEYPHPVTGWDSQAMPKVRTWCGPDIEADSWEDAVRKLLVLIEFGMVHPETEVIGKLHHEEEWERHYDN